MRSPAAIAKLYTDRALQLIRLGNGQSLSVRTELRKLASGLRALLDGQALPAMRKRELTVLLKKIEAMIAERFGAVSEQQSVAAEELANIEAAWAAEASGFDVDIDEGTLNGIASGLLIFGIPLAVMWSRQRDDLVTRVAGAVREVAAGAAAPETLLPRIMGSSPSREVGGLLQAALRNADALAHTTVAQVATDARIPVWKANGVNAFRWHAVLDEKTTAGCAIRHGLIYTIDGLEPINHKVPIERTPPRHYRCRSILLPMAYTSKLPAPKDGGQQTFRDYFDSLSEAEQDRLFGQGRAILFRRGVITQTDLVGQYGQVLSLDELRTLGKFTAYDEARAGGRYQGDLKMLRTMTQEQVRKAVRSYQRQIDKHLAWINDPYTTGKLSADFDAVRAADLRDRFWPRNIELLRERMAVVLGAMRERGIDP